MLLSDRYKPYQQIPSGHHYLHIVVECYQDAFQDYLSSFPPQPRDPFGELHNLVLLK